MQYNIVGEPLSVVVCELNAGESMITERGSMSWMSPNMKMETTSNGGICDNIEEAWGRVFRWRGFIMQKEIDGYAVNYLRPIE